MPRESRSAERGQILVIVAGGMIALLLLVGLVLDGGIALLNQRDGQNTADVASLAGTRLIADHYVDPAISHTQADIHAAIEDSVQDNGCTATGTPCSWTATFVNLALADVGAVTNSAAPIPPGAVGVRVNVHREPGTFLASLAGISHWNVDTQAIAIANEPTTAPPNQLLPIALKRNAGTPYVPGQSTTSPTARTSPAASAGSHGPARTIRTPSPTACARRTIPGSTCPSSSPATRERATAVGCGPAWTS